jgi:hypothetical protein
MNIDRLYLTKAALARAAGLDPRDKTLKEIEPDAVLISTGNKRLDLFRAALAESLKARQDEQ